MEGFLGRIELPGLYCTVSQQLKVDQPQLSPPMGVPEGSRRL